MRISGIEEMLQTSLITGPTHNFLRLTFAPRGNGLDQPVIVVDQPPARLAEHEVCAAVLQGSDDAGGLRDLGLCIASILYVGPDTPTPSVYQYMAKALVGQKRSDVLGSRSLLKVSEGLEA